MSLDSDAIRTFLLVVFSPESAVVGAAIAFIQVREQYRLRKLQVLSSLNERLSKCSKANKWIENPTLQWDDLDDDTKYEYHNYVATFEDIGLARRLRINRSGYFVASYGNRFRTLYSSWTLHKFIKSDGHLPAHFKN